MLAAFSISPCKHLSMLFWSDKHRNPCEPNGDFCSPAKEEKNVVISGSCILPGWKRRCSRLGWNKSEAKHHLFVNVLNLPREYSSLSSLTNLYGFQLQQYQHGALIFWSPVLTANENKYTIIVPIWVYMDPSQTLGGICAYFDLNLQGWYCNRFDECTCFPPQLLFQFSSYESHAIAVCLLRNTGFSWPWNCYPRVVCERFHPKQGIVHHRMFTVSRFAMNILLWRFDCIIWPMNWE